MNRLPTISGRTLVKVLEHNYFEFVRQRGSHIMMRQMIEPHITIPVPDHKELKPGTLRAILRDIGMTVQELNSIIDKL